ncbi:MAG: VOC family protein, partial [Candidatus Dormibacteraceae bacterium]
TKTLVANAHAWVDLSTSDPEAARKYYGKLFGWKLDDPSPDAGGYMLATLAGKNIAGLGPQQDPNAPSAWMVYIGSHDVDGIARKVEAAGGKVIAPPFDVLTSGRMSVFQDPSDAFISVWQPKDMQGADVMNAPNTFAWAELNSRGFATAKPFYTKLFGWGEKVSPMGEGQPDYTEFKLGGESIAGGMEMNPMVPSEVPSYWMVYFGVDDVDKAFKKAIDGGGQEMLAPQDFPGGRFAILSDPQGAAFGIMKMAR